MDVHRMFHHDSTAKNSSISLGLNHCWPAIYTRSTQEHAYKPGRPRWPTAKANSQYNTCCFMHTAFYTAKGDLPFNT